MFKSILLFIILLSIPTLVFSQSSFFKTIEDHSSELGQFLAKSGIVTNDNGDLFYMYGDVDGMFKLVQFSSDGTFLEGVRINYDGINLFSVWKPTFFGVKDNWNILGGINNNPSFLNDLNAIVVVNTETGTIWSKRTSVRYEDKNAGLITANEKVYCTIYDPIDSIPAFKIPGLAQLELETAEQHWSYLYKKTGATTKAKFVGIHENTDRNLSVLVQIIEPIVFTSQTSLVEIDTNGVLVQNVDILEDRLTPLSHTIDEESNIYIACRKKSEANNPSPYRDSDGVIIKLDKHFNLVWAKKLVAEQFDCADLKIKAFSNGDLIFSYQSPDFLPVITGKISSDGELLWHKGYAFVGSGIAIGQDSSIYLPSYFLFSENGYEQKTVIAKTDPSGNIAGCPQFDACLYLEDIELELESAIWERSDAPILPDIDVSMEPLGFTIIDTCGVPAHPEATFYFPDTLCQYDCLAPANLKNSLANYVEWTIIGPNIDTVFSETSFEWCFDSVGVYTIEQEIWLLGCSEFYSQSITVIANDIGLSLGDDAFICPDAPYVLTATTSHPLQQFLWSNGSQTQTINVSLPDDYSLTATDGYCIDSADISLTLIDDILLEDPLTIPIDTTLCPDFLPFELQPTSAYSTIFLVDEDTLLSGDVFKIREEGIYTIKTQVENCIFSKNFELQLEDCLVPIYIANIFSPNKDGVNDRVFPQGTDFEGIKLEVFNRWGDLLFETQQAPFEWDGRFGNEMLDSGVYVLVFTYFNQRNLREEVMSQDVLLLR